MKTPLRYQMSEYDCGPTAMLDAVSFLFEREEIPPEVIRNIMLYCLDCYSAEGITGKSGTSCTAMMFLSHWLNNFGQIGQLAVSSRYLSGEMVFLGAGSAINSALHRGGAAVVRLFLDEWHYALLTGEKDGVVQLFDPYLWQGDFPEKGIRIVEDHPYEYNRIVPERFCNREELAVYAFGPLQTREAILLFNDATKLDEEAAIEYFI